MKPAFVATLLALLVGAPALAAPEPVTIKTGEWSATFGPTGVALTQGGQVISGGSYLQVFTPEYKGSLIGSAEAWKQGKVDVAAGDRAATLAADLPNGRYACQVELTDAGARITTRVSVAAGAQVGPVEYAILQIPEGLVAGGSVEVWNAAGLVTTKAPVPPEAGQRGMTPAGQGIALRTPARGIVVEAEDFGSVYPLDARHERYGARRGIWAFAGPAVAAGGEPVSVYSVRVAPAAPARTPGRITIAPASPASVLVTAPNPTKREDLAATELVDYLEAMAGRRLERKESRDAKAPAGAILVGPAARAAGLISQKELDRVGPDGYVVKVRAGRVGVCGWRDVGTLYGAYALLRHLGCRFHAPACETVPRTDSLLIPEYLLAEKPFFEFRNLAGNLKLGNTPSDDMMNPRDIGEPGNIVHSSEYLLPFDKYHQEHPEYFALQKDGQRLRRTGDPQSFAVHLCLSNPDVRRISAERMLALIEKQPERRFFGVSQGDGFAWCQCEKCKALDAVPGVEMTDRLLDYVNFVAREVARKYPDKRILTLAYTDATSPPPTRVLPEPNVMVQYCPYPHRTDCSSHDLNCEKNTQGRQDLMGWTAKCPANMYIFDYPTGYQNWYEPFGSFTAMKRKMDVYAARGVRGLFYCGTPQNFRALFIYVQSHLLWRPNTPVEPLIEEFMKAYYGAAAPRVRAYFDYMHREFDQRPIHQMCEGPSPHTVTPAYAEEALKLLGQAEEAVRTDRARLYRVRAEKLCVLFGDLNARNPVTGTLAVGEDVFAARLAEFAHIGRTQRISQFVRRLPTEDWLYRVARIRPTRSPWYADPLIERLVADPVKALAAEQQKYAQTEVPGGWRLELDGFRGGKGPEEYAHECPRRKAVWIYGTNTPHPRMWTIFRLNTAPAAPARLAVTAQDDDKPGAIRIRVTVNDRAVFEGPNPFVERGWSTKEFPIPAGVLRQGDNDVRFATLDESAAADAGWFMVAECGVVE